MCLYAPVAVAGYVVLGDDVSTNILMDVQQGAPVALAMVAVMLNLLVTYVIDLNPINQALEEVLGIPRGKLYLVDSCKT